MISTIDITVLLIEANPDLRTATRDLLENLGCEVRVARDLNHALEIVGMEPPDLAMVNAYPADGSGLATVDALRAAAPGLPALLASGFGDELDLRRRVLAGDVSFLSIPFSAPALERKILETLGQSPRDRLGISDNRTPAAASTFKPARSDRPRIYLAAAVAVFTVGLAAMLADRPPRMPDLQPGEARRGHTIELLEPIGALDAPPERLVWRAAPESVGYRVVLSTVDDTTIWQSETRETSIEIPEEVVMQLQSAVTYFWQVEGLGENLAPTGRSILVAFRFGVSGPVSQEV